MKKILLLTILALAFSSCKEDEGGSSNKSVTDLLTNGIWKFNSITTEPPTWVAGPCKGDDLLVFKTGGIATFDDGTISCGGDQTYNVSWLLSVDEKSITIEDGGRWTCGFNLEDIWKIVSLTEDMLVVQYNDQCGGGGGGPWKVTLTFKH